MFFSNFFFNGLSNYFDAAVKLNPLLHTWSLSVEEQFYVVFPLLAFAIRKFDHNRKFIILLSIAVVSLAWSSWLVHVDRSDAFYLPQSRAWELILGSLLTLGVIPEVRGWKAEATATGGMLLILISAVVLSEYSTFPGLGALAPSVGAAAVIHSGLGKSTIVSRILSTRPMVGIGLISYSMYLWHWPIIVFCRTFYGEPSRLTKLGFLVAVIAISYFSLKFIEKPFRSKPHLLTGLQTLAAGGLTVTALGLAAVLLIPVALSVRQIPAYVFAVDRYTNYDAGPNSRSGQCFLTRRSNDLKFFDIEKCLHIKETGTNVLLMGDSHAAHLWIGLSTRYPEINFLQATSSGCKPVISTRGEKRCSDLIKMVFSNFLPNHHVDGIILSGDWVESDLAAIEETVEFLQNLSNRIFVIGPSPFYTRPLPMILARQMLNGTQISRAEFLRSEQIHIDEKFETRLARSAARYISLYKAICTKECLLWSGENEPLQFDSNHFTKGGSIKVAETIGPQMFQIGTGRER